MRLDPGRLLVHFVGAVLVCAPLAFWTLRLTTPPPAPAPDRVQPVTTQNPDPVLLARAFGQVEVVASPALANILVAGVYAGGSESAAVFVVGDRPAVAVRLGQEVAPGSVLVEVDAQGVTLDSGGVRRQLRLPNPPVVTPGGGASAPRTGLHRRRNPMASVSVSPVPAPYSAGGTSSSVIVPPPPEPTPEPTPGAIEGRQVVGTTGPR
jgi:general secretion pathway protein C